MSKIIVNEIDNTKTPALVYSNFSVVIPGFCGNTTVSVLDDNGIYECDSPAKFKTNIGLTHASKKVPAEVHQGNQIAYELLKLGYTVLFKSIDAYGEGTWESELSKLNEANFWAPLKDKSLYDFRYICTGGYVSKAANEYIIDVASYDKNYSGRGDCTALIDLDESGNNLGKTQSEFISKIAGVVNGTSEAPTKYNKYTALFAPQVIINKSNLTDISSFNNNQTFPASFYYLACATKAKATYAEWYAVAGYTRGISDYKIDGTTIKLGDLAVNTVQPRKLITGGVKHAVNIIIKDRNGYYLWGNRTGFDLIADDSTAGTIGELKASHFLNIRQLCSTLKKDLYFNCRKFTFDPNSDLLWVNFCNTITPTLEKMKADQGISDYKIIKIKSDVKALLTAKIRIVPIEAVEDFEIDIYLEDSISGISVKADDIAE